MSGITYLVGDATVPHGPAGAKIIAHCCNNIGVWGAGFVLALSKRWKEPEAEYRTWCREEYQTGPALGAVQFVDVGGGILVANIIGQSGTGWRGDVPPVRYAAIERGLDGVGVKARQIGATVHLPRLGCGLAGGVWSRVEPLIVDRIVRRGVPVFVYDFGATVPADKPARRELGRGLVLESQQA